MFARPLILFMSLLTMAWVIWIAVALHIAREMQADPPAVYAAYDTPALAYEPSSVCMLRTVPRRISRA